MTVLLKVKRDWRNLNGSTCEWEGRARDSVTYIRLLEKRHDSFDQRQWMARLNKREMKWYSYWSKWSVSTTTFTGAFHVDWERRGKPLVLFFLSLELCMSARMQVWHILTTVSCTYIDCLLISTRANEAASRRHRVSKEQARQSPIEYENNDDDDHAYSIADDS